MKRILLSLLILLSVGLSFAQQETTIYGKMTNCENLDIHIVIQFFDPISMRSSDQLRTHGKTVKAEIGPDSSYVLKTDKIIHPYTSCILLLGTQNAIILLSPGDSLRIDLDCQTFETGLKFKGQGSGYNNYWQEISQRFREIRRFIAVGDNSGQLRIDLLTDYRDDQLRIVGNYLSDLEIDSSFFIWESKRIKYNYYSDLLNSSLGHRTEDSIAMESIVETVSDFDLNDEAAFLTIPAYRTLIRSYLGFMRDPYGQKPPINLVDRLELGNQNLKGDILSFYLWNIIDGAVESAETKTQKDIIWLYAWDNIEDIRVKNLLQEKKAIYMLHGQYKLLLSLPIGFYITMIIGLLILFGIGYFTIKTIQNSQKSNVNQTNIKLNPLSRLSLVMVFMLSTALVLFGIRRSFNIWQLLSSVTIFAFFLIHTRLLIPHYASRKKFFLYGLYLVLLIFVYYLAFYFNFKFLRATSTSSIVDTVNKIVVFTTLPLVLYSFSYYAVDMLGKKEKPFRYLFDKGIVSMELLGNIFLASLIYLFIGRNINLDNGVRHMALFLLSLGVFYAYAFWIGPKLILKQQYLRGMFQSILVIIATGLIASIIEAINLGLLLNNLGIEKSFFQLLRFPLNHLDLYLILIPAFGYAYFRRRVISYFKEGFTLFRKKEAELNQLRSQVNPHFLFNSLNTVYALALKEKSDKTAESIAKLANMMRYLIDDMEQDKIPIRKEIGYIEDYVKLQLIRSSEKHNIKINVDLTEDQQEWEIAPMLMIPFVENAFKHGINPNKPSELSINFSNYKNGFQFMIENSVDKNFEAFYKEKGFGIGIENVRKRLEYIYPDKHTLSIADTEDSFIVIMEIQL